MVLARRCENSRQENGYDSFCHNLFHNCIYVFYIFMIFFWGFMKICNRYYQNYYQKLFATKDILSWIYVIVAFMVIILGLFEMCLCCNTMSINHYLGNNGLSMIKPMLEYCLLTGLSGTFSFLLLFRSGLVYFFSKKIVKLIEEEKKQ